jgi:hypothetical protein
LLHFFFHIASPLAYCLAQLLLVRGLLHTREYLSNLRCDHAIRTVIIEPAAPTPTTPPSGSAAEELAVMSKIDFWNVESKTRKRERRFCALL